MAQPPYLPLAWSRGIFMLALFITTNVANSFCINMFKKHGSEQKRINQNLPEGITVKLVYNDVFAPTVVLFIGNVLANIVSSKVVFFLIQARYNCFSKTAAKWLGIPSKKSSTRSLPMQSYTMLASAALIAVAVGYMQFAVSNHQMTLDVQSDDVPAPISTVQDTLDSLGITLVYQNISYITNVTKTCLAALATTVPATVVTLIAWSLRPRQDEQEDDDKVEMVAVDPAANREP